MTEQAGDKEGFEDRGGLDWPHRLIWLRAPRLSPRATRAARLAARIGLMFLAAACVALGLFFGALARGPIALDWLAPTIVESLDEIYSGRYVFSLASATIANSGHGPTLTVDGLKVRSGDRIVLAAPKAELSVDFPSLLLGRLKPRRLEALDLELRLSVMRDGTVAISAGTDAANAVPLQPPASQAPPSRDSVQSPPQAPLVRTALLHQAGEAIRGIFDFVTSPDSAIGAIDRLGVLHGRLVIDDRTVDRAISYDDLTLTLDRAHEAVRVSASARRGSRRWGATVTARGALGGRRAFDAEAHNLSIDEIALAGGLRNLKFDTDAPLSGQLHFALGADDHVAEARGALRIGAGFFRLDDPDHEPVMIDAISASAQWDKASRRLVIAPVRFAAGGFDMAIEGSAAPPPGLGGAGGEDLWSLSLALAKPTLVSPERANEKPISIERGQLQATFLSAEKKLSVDRFEFAGPDVNASLLGTADWSNGPHVAFGLNVRDTRIPALMRLWPSHAASGARNWLLEHVAGGMVRRGSVEADYNDAALDAMRYGLPPPDRSVHADFDVEDGLLVDLLAGAPPFTGVVGHTHVTGRTVSFSASAGALETAPGHRLTLAAGEFSIPDNAASPTMSSLELRLAGNVEAVSDLLAMPAIAPYASLPLEPGALKGAIDGKLRVAFEIGPNPRPERTTIGIDAMTQNLSIERFAGTERLENAALSVVRDSAGLRVTGGGRLYGAPTILDLRRPAGEKGPAQAQLTLTFDDAARAKSGFAIPGLVGPVYASLKTAVPMTEGDTQIELDLTRAALDGPLPGLVKPAGKVGKASFVLARRNDTLALDQLAIDAGGAQIIGNVELAHDGAFKSAKFSQLRLSPGDDAHVEAQRGLEAVKVTVRGANLDARPIIHWLTQGGVPATPAPAPAKGAFSFDDMDLDFKSPIVSGYGKQILANVDIKLERRAGRLRALSLSGHFGRETLTATMPRTGAQIDVATVDAGSLLSFMDFYHRMESGGLAATVQIGPARSDGSLKIKDFYLKNEPAMRQLMTQGAARSDDRGNVRFDPDSVRFSRLQSGFTWSGGTLTLREGVMSGPEIGLTFDGFIDFARDRVDVSGAYVPAYALNNLLSNIPVLGVVLAGGQHEGIFALNYRVLGQVGAPVINVNPLSAIAPGLMRKIMGVMDGTGRPIEQQQQPQQEQPSGR